MPTASSPQAAIKQNPQAAFDRALGFLRSGDLPKALALCKHIVSAMPAFADAWLLLGQLQLDIQRPERALQCVERALDLNPGNLKAELLRAECLIADSQGAAALTALKSLESSSQDQALMLRLVANLYAGLLSYSDASRCFQRSLKLDPNDMEGWHLYSGVLFARGLMAEAEDALNEVLRLNPQHGEALLTRSSMRKQTEQDNHLEQLEGMLEAGQLSPEDTVMLCYALAREFEDMGEYPAAFRYLQQGADKKDSLLNYEVERDVAFMDKLALSFSQEISGRQTNSALGEGLVFIVSLPRAGSTLVDRILATHSSVQSLGETGAFHEALLQHARRASAAKKMTFTDALTHINYASLGETYLGKLKNYAANTPVLIDKTPANLQYLGLLHQALPAAKIVHVQKSPMDACYSVYKTYFNRGYGYSYSLQKLGRYYIAYQRMMDYWREALHGAFLELSYEQLLDSQEVQTRRLLEYCGLDWQQQCMDFHLNSSPTATASVVQVRQPLFRSSLQRWRCYEEQLAPLAAILRDADIEIG